MTKFVKKVFLIWLDSMSNQISIPRVEFYFYKWRKCRFLYIWRWRKLKMEIWEGIRTTKRRSFLQYFNRETSKALFADENTNID